MDMNFIVLAAIRRTEGRWRGVLFLISTVSALPPVDAAIDRSITFRHYRRVSKIICAIRISIGGRVMKSTLLNQKIADSTFYTGLS
jgi:hypothetical protein